MSSTILAAIIGGLCTIGGSIIAVFVTRFLDNPMGLQKNERLRALVGPWHGIVHQEAFGPAGIPVDHRITIDFTLKNRTIHGKGNVYVTYQNTTFVEPDTSIGGFVHDRFLKLEYSLETEPGSIQFGYVILELKPNGKILSGRLVGYGSRFTGDFVSGTVELHKGTASDNTQALPTTIV